MQCRERIIRDFRSGGGHRPDERRFSRIWETEQADIGQQPSVRASDGVIHPVFPAWTCAARGWCCF